MTNHLSSVRTSTMPAWLRTETLENRSPGYQPLMMIQVNLSFLQNIKIGTKRRLQFYSVTNGKIVFAFDIMVHKKLYEKAGVIFSVVSNRLTGINKKNLYG